jgi:hypothetical protein
MAFFSHSFTQRSRGMIALCWLDVPSRWFQRLNLLKAIPSHPTKHRQLVQRDFRGSYCSVQRYIRKRLGVAGMKRERAGAARPSALPLPSPRQLSKDGQTADVRQRRVRFAEGTDHQRCMTVDSSPPLFRSSEEPHAGFTTVVLGCLT